MCFSFFTATFLIPIEMDSLNNSKDFETIQGRPFLNSRQTVTTLENEVNDLISEHHKLSKLTDKTLYLYEVQMKNIKQKTEVFRKKTMEELDWYLSKIKDRCSESVHVLEESVASTWCSRLKYMEEELGQLQKEIEHIKQNEGEVNLERIELRIKLKCKALSEMADLFKHQFGHRMPLTPNFESFFMRLSSALTDLTFDQDFLLNKDDRSTESVNGIFLKSFKKIIATDIQRQFQTTDLRGCTTLSGKLVFSDYGSHHLLIYSRDGHFHRMIKLRGKPFCVTSVENGKVAITFHDLKCVEIYDLETDSVCQVIDLENNCAGISYSKGILVVRVEDIGYQMFDICSGKLVREVRIDGKNMPYVSYIDERLYYTNWNTGKVICSDLNGKLCWEFKNEILQTPNGIASDSFGNVFVSGFSSNNIIVISKDGLSAKSMNSDDSLTKPIGMYYDNETDELLVTLATGHGILYKVNSS